MSTDAAATGEKRVSLGVVFITLGGLVLFFVLLIWVVAPRTIPAPIYQALAPYLPQEGPIPTRMAQISLPTIADARGKETAVLLPETNLAESYPDYFVSAADAVVTNPLAGQPLLIRIPAINLETDVVEVSLEQHTADDGQTYFQWQVPAGYLVGWHGNSARLGQPGNTVLNGHHNIFGEVFRHLIDLETGDEITLSDSHETYTYRVTTKEILPELGQPLEVRLENARWMEPTTDERITLISCWPYTGNSHRLVIVAQPVDS